MRGETTIELFHIPDPAQFADARRGAVGEPEDHPRTLQQHHEALVRSEFRKRAGVVDPCDAHPPIERISV